MPAALDGGVCLCLCTGDEFLKNPISSGRHRVLAVNVNKSEQTGGREIAAALLASPALRAYSLVLLFDAAIDLANPSLMLWKLFNNTDPGRDLLIQSGRAVVDASIKGTMDGHTREWPEELTFDV